VLGVDAGGATRPGLLLVRRLAREAFVFYDRSGRTFHPKVYFAEGADRAALLVGSSNATAGGLFTNYEASLEVAFVLPDDDDAAALVGVRGYVERLVQESALCLRLTDDLIARLIDVNAFNVQQHERTPAASSPGGDDDSARDLFGENARDIEFGRRATLLTGTPRLSWEATHELRQLEGNTEDDGDELEPAVAVSAARGGTPEAGSQPHPTVVRRWYKTLWPADAQQLPTSSPSAALTLVANRHPIDISTYFRDTFFGGAQWILDGSKELADVDCDVTVGGTNLGRMRMTVVHDPGFESDQGNRTTLLRWGEFQQYLRANDLAGNIVTLEALANGTFRVIIDASPAGAFID
jgi:hypothetical protein